MSGVAISVKEMHESEKELTGIYVCICITQREEMWDDPWGDTGGEIIIRLYCAYLQLHIL